MKKVRVYPLSQSNYTSQIYAGLFDLAARNEIELTFTSKPLVRIRERDWGSRENRRIAYVELWENDIRPIAICYDMLDGPEIISLDGLEKCDVYFKRSFSQLYINSHNDLWQTSHPEYRQKILPYGLNMPGDSEFEFGSLKRTLLFCQATKLHRHKPNKAISFITEKALQNIVGWKKKHLTVAKVVPTEPAELLVLFQTRLFDPTKQVKTDEVAALNQSRINIVRALRAAFGKNFIGGFIPNSYTVQHYPDLLTNENTARNKYFELVKRCLVVVFTRGLRQSIGWRLPELLAMSRCVVSEPLAYKLPVPLKENVNYLLFDEPDQCIEACKTLLNNSDLAQQMRKNNYDYYHRYVEASALIRNSLETASKIMNSI